MTFTTYYNSLRSKIGSYFSEKKEIVDPYDLENNTDMVLKDSWGLGVGGATIREDLAPPTQYLPVPQKNREFTLALSREYVESDKNTVQRVAIEAQLISDGNALMSHLITGGCVITDFSDGGVELIKQNKFLTINFTFTVRVQE